MLRLSDGISSDLKLPKNTKYWKRPFNPPNSW
jgi:hypothetical protein